MDERFEKAQVYVSRNISEIPILHLMYISHVEYVRIETSRVGCLKYSHLRPALALRKATLAYLDHERKRQGLHLEILCDKTQTIK